MLEVSQDRAARERFLLVSHRKPRSVKADLAPSHQPAVLELHPGGLDVPDASPEWSEKTVEAWEVYWRSDVAQAARDVDEPAVRRLFSMRDEYDVCVSVARQELVVEGSRGQLRINPLATHAQKLETAIARLEGELGVTPAARARLGLTLASGGLYEVQRRMAQAAAERRAAMPRRRRLPKGYERA